MSSMRKCFLLLAVLGACGGDDETTTAGTTTSSASGGGGAGGGGVLPDGCVDGTAMAGDNDFMLSHGGLDRTYRLHLPASYDGSPVPLVFNFHGLGSNSTEQALFSAMTATADDHGFAVVYADGYMSSWNGGACCGNASADMIDDVGFTRSMLADIESKACIDKKRVYSTGMSNGGIFSHRLACDASDIIAAVAPVCGALLAGCNPERPMPVMAFNGTADMLVTYDLAQGSNDAWVAEDMCTDMPEVTFMMGAATCETHSQCAGGAKVTFCHIEGMGHCWPGQSFCPPSLGMANTDISANEEMWTFFEQFSLP
jgi:polyhydroxybutyrate depolymerase